MTFSALLWPISLRPLSAAIMSCHTEKLQQELKRFVQEHHRFPRENRQRDSTEARLAARCRMARRSGRISVDFINTLESAARQQQVEFGRDNTTSVKADDAAGEASSARRGCAGPRHGNRKADKLKSEDCRQPNVTVTSEKTSVPIGKIHMDLTRFVSEHGRMPMENPQRAAAEGKLARRCRKARSRGEINAEFIQNLLDSAGGKAAPASQTLMLELTEFAKQYGRLPREQVDRPPAEFELAQRCRYGLRDRIITAEFLEQFESRTEQLMADLADFQKEHGRLPMQSRNRSSAEVHLARRCRESLNAGAITQEFLEELESQPGSLKQDLTEFFQKHGRLPRENGESSPSEHQLARRRRRGLEDGDITAEFLEDSANFASESGCVAG